MNATWLPASGVVEERLTVVTDAGVYEVRILGRLFGHEGDPQKRLGGAGDPP
jgi:hypothetical protein